MSLETGTYISDLVATNPTSSDPKSEGDDHLRLLKSTIKTTFPSITGAVTATQAELNIMDGVTATAAELNYSSGVTSGLQTQLDSKLTVVTPEQFAGDIQAALNSAGMVIQLAPATTYTLNAVTLTIPDGKTLIGANWGIDDITNCSVLALDNNSQIIVGAGSTFSDVAINYNNQNYTTPVQYSDTIVPKTRARIQRISHFGAWNLIKSLDENVEKVFIDQIHGYALNSLVDIPQSLDTPRITNIHMNPNSMRSLGMSDPDLLALSVRQRQTNEVIRLGKVDECYMQNVFGFGVKSLVHAYRRTDSDITNSGFKLVNWGADLCHDAFVFDRGQNEFGTFISQGFATPAVAITGSVQALCKITDTSAQETTGTNIFFDGVAIFGNYPTLTGDLLSAVNYVVDETIRASSINNTVYLDNYMFQHNTGLVDTGFTAAGSSVRYGSGLNNFAQHGVSTDKDSVILPIDTIREPATLLNSWVSFATNFSPFRFYKDPGGIVHVWGVIKTGTANSNIYELPIGYRPEFHLEINALCDGATQGGLIIYNDGFVQQLFGTQTQFAFNTSFKPL